MAGCIVQVWFEIERENDQRRPNFQMIETQFPDFQGFCEAVDADRLIGGDILWTHNGAPGEKIIHDRQPCAFRGSAVMRCWLPRWTIIEES